MYCTECKEFHSDGKCLPVYTVTYDDYDKKIGAHGHWDAAMKFGEHYNSNSDYCLMNEEIEVSVEFEGVTKRFKVSAEPSIDYNADEII
ncbi:MAG: hypothetical protein V4687_15940 [Bacteroidota bacterium]